MWRDPGRQDSPDLPGTRPTRCAPHCEQCARRPRVNPINRHKGTVYAVLWYRRAAFMGKSHESNAQVKGPVATPLGVDQRVDQITSGQDLTVLPFFMPTYSHFRVDNSRFRVYALHH